MDAIIAIAIMILSSPIFFNVIAQIDPPFKIRADVDLVNVEVVALDKKGEPVHNLNKENLKIYEDRIEQSILSLDEVNENSSFGDEDRIPRGKTVLLVFDDASTRMENMKSSRDSAEIFVRSYMRSRDLFAVASYGPSLRILQSFTGDKEKILKAIGEVVKSHPTGGLAAAEGLLGAFREIAPSLAQIKGRKSIIVYSQSIVVEPSSMPTFGGVLSEAYATSGTFVNAFKKGLEDSLKANITYYTISPVGDGRNSSWLSVFARESGGYGIITNDGHEELRGLDRKLSNYYIIGYQSNNRIHNGKFRKLEVRTDLKGVMLQCQDGYQDRSPADILKKSEQEKILMNASDAPNIITKIPITFRPIYFYDSPQTARVLMETRILMDRVVLRKNGGGIRAKLNVMGVAYTEDGKIAARFSEILPINFVREKETEYRQKGFPYRNYFILHPGKYRLKLAVSDESDNIGTYAQDFSIPVYPDQGFGSSSLIIAEQISRLPDLTLNLRANLFDEKDPLIYSGIRMEPSVGNRFAVDSALRVMFRLYNLTESPDSLNLSANVMLRDEKGMQYMLEPISLKKAMSFGHKGEAAVGLQLSFPKVPPGKYRLLVDLYGTIPAAARTIGTDVEFTR